MNDTTNVGTEEGAVCTHNRYAAKYLREIANGRAPEIPWNGLCYNLSVALQEAGIDSRQSVYGVVTEYAPLWPEYSGNTDYPVSCQGVDAHYAYTEADLWKGEYGAARRRLAGFIADELEKEI